MASAARELASLSPSSRALAQLHAVFAPHGLTATQLECLLEESSLAELPLPAKAVREDALAELTTAGVALRRPNGAVAILPAVALALMREARAEGTLILLLDAMAAWQERGDAEPYDAGRVRARREAYQDDWRTSRLLVRGYLLAGDSQRFEACVEKGRTDPSLLAEPFAEEALRAVPLARRQAACKACLARVIEVCAPADALIDVSLAISETPQQHIDDVAFIRVLQGRFDAALEVFDSLPANLYDPVARLVGHASTRALIAMLRGDDGTATAAINEALDALRGNRKRLVFPEPRAFALALLALARQGASATEGLLADIGDARRWGQPDHLGLELAFDAAQVKAKSGLGYHNWRSHGFSGLFAGIRRCWLNEVPEAEDVEGLQVLWRRAKDNGFAWVAAECRAVLERLAPAEFKGTVSDGPDHAALGTTTLTTLAPPAPPWQDSLAIIQELAEAPEAEQEEDAPALDGRMVWTLHVGSGYVRLDAREQRRREGGSWTRGKQYGAKRLAAESTRMTFLLPQDKAAIAAASTRLDWYKKESYFGLASLHALAGHPLVLDKAGQPVEVVQRAPELSVDHAEDGGLVVRVEPYRAGSDGAYSMNMPAPGRCEVTHFTADHQRLFEAIPEEGLKLPSRARQPLLSTVPGLASRVRVASSVQNVAVGAEPVEADAEPWVRLEPLDAGLSVALAVEPIAGAGNSFAPGSGGVVVFASVDGKNLQAERDFDAEQAAVEKLVERCSTLASQPTTARPLVVPRAQDCLELLEELEAAEARCKWPHGEAMRIVAHADNDSLRLTMKSAAQWMQASGELRVDDERVLDLKRLFTLLEDNPDTRFLPLGDGSFLSLARTFRRRLDDFAAVATVGAKGAARLDSLAALALEELINGADLQADEGWAALLERARAANAVTAEVPSTLQAELRSYQQAGYEWLARLAEWGVGACLADDMGLGKTIQTLAVLLRRAPGGPALVVAPTSVLPNWVAEARRFAPTLALKTYTGNATTRAALLDGAGPFDLVLTTYGLLQNDVNQLAALAWHTVVLDEAQAIKNPNAKRSRAAKRLQADFRVITTGTPVQNNLMDLHSLFGFANPGLLGSLRHFRAYFALPIERDDNPRIRARLKRLVDPFVLRRLKADVLEDLPSRTEITLHVKLSKEEASLYEALRQRAVDELAAAADDGRMRLLAHLTRLRLACCSPLLVKDAAAAANLPMADLPAATASAKLETFASTLEDLLANRHKVLVFSQFVMHLRLIEEHLESAGIAYQYLDGATPPKERAARIAAFQAGEGDVFLISLTAGGVGLNLTAADYVIHMDPWWNPAVEDQASDRAHRIGQTRPVTIYRLVAEGTIEEQIVDLHHRKRDLAEQLLEATDTPTGIDLEEIATLLRRPFAA